jgi:UDP-N-acetylglucosamine:LPS N-acetylglucosamine transferase
VSAAGYNSFHELLGQAVPTVFVPNENPMMDAQEIRAAWAERQGLAFCVRRHDPYRMAWALKALLDPARRAELSGRCRALPPCDGAEAAPATSRASPFGAAAARGRPSPHALTRA